MSEPIGEVLSGHDYAREKQHWLHDHHWDPLGEATITTPGQAGQQALGAAVATGKTRRIREVTVTNTAGAITLIELYVGNTCILSFYVGATDSVTWHSEDGRKVAAGNIVYVRSSAAAAGTPTRVSVAGVEA
ncbi:MAG: hypothetical protein KKC55_14400 [Gammaproteobacteria bacterium]|nr:hypothetical protein [Gammaproteobacteria bacterium]